MAILSNYYDRRDFAGLIDFCNSKIEIDNSNYLFLGARGKAYIELEEYDKAIIDITKALELHPNYATGLYNRGICYYKTEKYELAIIDLEKAKSLNNELYSIDFYLGVSYSCLENYEKGIELFSNHLLDYKDEAALKCRADLYNLTNQFKKANKDIAKLLLIETANLEKIEKINEIRKAVITNKEIGDMPFVLSEIGFTKLKDEKSSGIYILELKNNEYYIGQAKKIHIRIRQHHKKCNDIETIYFKPVEEGSLLSEENNTISIFETNNLRIRNLKQVEFLNIFNESNQHKWNSDIKFNSLTGSKFDSVAVREKFKDRFLILKEKPYFEELIISLSKYLKSAIPNYLASEFNYWNITCLPNFLKEANCISRINVNAVPVLSVFEESNKSLTFMVYASKLPFLRFLNQNGIDSLLDQIPTLRIELRDAFGEKTEGDEILFLINQKDFQNAMDNQLVLSSIRIFNLRMMNNVGKELKYRRTTFHCLDLSDLIINRLAIDEKKNGL